MKRIRKQETWLFKNKRAAQMIRQGLEDAKRGRLVKRKEDFSKTRTSVCAPRKTPSSPS